MIDERRALARRSAVRTDGGLALMHRFVIALSLALAAVAPALAAADTPDVQTVPKVEISRYLGTWYEIAYFPRFFMPNCVSDTTDDYGVTKDGNVSVTNRCHVKDGSLHETRGVAEPEKGSNNAKLKVTFVAPFTGDYWVVGLDPDYRWAVIGSPNRKSLWILSRTPQMPQADLKLALAAAAQQQYPMEKLKYTQQGAVSTAR
jgi:apolipoprotein D and lipocalin family protein